MKAENCSVTLEEYISKWESFQKTSNNSDYEERTESNIIQMRRRK